eukprot:9470696-Pyramimonas_sp.AAC.1
MARYFGRAFATTLGHMGDSRRRGAAVIRRRRLRSAAPCWLATGVPGVLNPIALGCGSFSQRTLPWGFGPSRRGAP